MRTCQSLPSGTWLMGAGVIPSFPLQKGQVSTCGRGSCGLGVSSFFGRMLRAVATRTDSPGTIGLILISRTSFACVRSVFSIPHYNVFNRGFPTCPCHYLDE